VKRFDDEAVVAFRSAGARLGIVPQKTGRETDGRVEGEWGVK
jgi:hypothetical protein